MKKLTLGLFLIMLSFAGARLLNFSESGISSYVSWTTFQKHPNHPNLVRSHISTSDEKKSVNISAKSIKRTVRKPASIAKNPMEQIKYEGRELFNFIDKKQKSVNNLSALNSPSKNWKGLAARKLLRFQDPTTKLLIKPEKSLINVEEKGARYVEIVQVKFLSQNGKQTSYNALIDSQSGTLIRSWNQSIQDAPYERKEKVELSITGSL